MTSTSPTRIVGPAAAVPALAVAFVVLAITASFWLAVPVGLVVGVGAFLLLRRSALSVALHELGALPISDSRRPRVDNIVEGLCLSSGLRPPRIHVAELSAPDAAMVGRSPDDADLVVTVGALDDLTRLELEALVARALCLLDSDVETSTVLCAAGRILGRGALAGRYISRRLDPDSVVLADFAGVRLTRYPPALAAAMTHARSAGGVPSHADTNHLWLFGPANHGDPRRPSFEQRIDTLQEL